MAAPNVLADAALGALVDSTGTTVESKAAGSGAGPAEDTGSAASEVLSGNGTRAGYMLGHGNVIAGSEWVDVGAKHASRNRDYTIDYDSGSIFFTEPVSTMDSVRVDYRYSTKAKADRSGTPGLVALRFGNSMQTNMLYSYRAADASQGFGAQDILTYGLNTNTKLGGGSSLASMFYVASPETSNRMSFDAAGAPVKSAAKKLKRDQLMVQDANLNAGRVRLKLGYQDVGQDFAGFNSLKESSAADKDVLNQLEKEKGIHRMSIAGDVPSTVKDQGLSFALSQVADKTDEISTRSLGYRGSGFIFNYSARDVGKRFSRFKDIREADRAQMAAEVGMSRTNFGMQFKTGLAKDNKIVWSGFNFMELSGDSGTMSYRTADVDMGKVKVQADIRTMDDSFNRMAALNDDERVRMALMARRQFDPTAPADQVTADDKAALNHEQGLDRSTCLVQMDGNAVDTWLSLSSVDSANGGLTRKAFGVKGGTFAAYFNSQSVDRAFSRLAALQPVERAHYGNESGMTRTELGGKLNVMRSDLTFDTANVIDNGAGFFREALTVKNKRLDLKANFQNIDAGFNRISDLSDPDKQTLLKEKGFQRSDYAVNFQATKALNIDTYIYDSTNSTEGQTRSQNRFKIAYAPAKGPKINAMSDDYSYIADTGNIASYSHQEVKFDHNLNLLGGLAIRGRNDVYTNQEGVADPQTTTISENHIESNQKAKTSFTADVVNMDYGNGHFDNLHAVSVKTLAVRSLSLIGGMATTERDSGKSEANGKFGFEWAMRKDLKMSFTMANRNGGPQGGQQSSSFSLNGPIAKRFLIFNDINVASATNQTALRGRQTVCDNALKMDAGMLGGKLTFDNTDKLNAKTGIYYTSRVFQFESNKDPKIPFHINFFRQNLTTPQGVAAQKRNYSLDFKLAGSTMMTLSSYEGKDAQNGAVTPVKGTVVKFSRQLSKNTGVMADYSADSNLETDRYARVFGFGLTQSVTSRTSYEVYYGICDLDEGKYSDHKGVYRLKFDTKLNADRYLSLSLQRKSGVDKSSINPLEGDTVGRVDLKFLFD